MCDGVIWHDMDAAGEIEPEPDVAVMVFEMDGVGL